MIEQLIQKLTNRHILILGFGREGQSTLQFILNHHIDCRVTVADANAPEEDWLHLMRLHQIGGLFGPEHLDWSYPYDMIMKSPGIPSRNIPQKFRPLISSQTDLFLEFFKKQTIGVTGTKGKSTTSTMIYHLLKHAEKNALLTGNIGIPCFDIIPQIAAETIVVFEMSAHQLEFVHHSPHIALLLNIFAEHLDHFVHFELYQQAKLNILKYLQAGDVAILHSSLKHLPEEKPGVIMHDYDNYEISLPGLPLQGEHFVLLAKAALLAAKSVGIGLQKLLPAINTFEPLVHRLEPLGPYDGVLFINDSIATVPEAAFAAIKAWKPDFLILGGFDRGIDYSLITDAIRKYDIPYILLTGEAGKRMGEIIGRAFPEKELYYFEKMEEAFEIIATHASPGQVVLLSPAAASYDRYKNFEHRGDLFKLLAKNFKRKNPDN